MFVAIQCLLHAHKLVLFEVFFMSAVLVIALYNVAVVACSVASAMLLLQRAVVSLQQPISPTMLIVLDAAATPVTVRSRGDMHCYYV